MARPAAGDESISITVSTKVTPSVRDHLIEKYGSAYAGLQAALQCVTEEEAS